MIDLFSPTVVLVFASLLKGWLAFPIVLVGSVLLPFLQTVLVRAGGWRAFVVQCGGLLLLVAMRVRNQSLYYGSRFGDVRDFDLCTEDLIMARRWGCLVAPSAVFALHAGLLGFL